MGIRFDVSAPQLRLKCDTAARKKRLRRKANANKGLLTTLAAFTGG
ncbi:MULTISPECIES: hypothetical protein [Pseudoalteromonas]|nr:MULTISPECIES: hypothetical protein [Pseudoalteromonas]KZN36330.1 hypothetical protein N483_22730 [Pseudoalteromonas luteoviolacea NCIMB 1944]MCG7550115.1 hypothetical protein [Pseudoalteromonas sp. Of7M-16]